MSKHIIKGISKLISNLLDLQLLSVDLILNVINSLQFVFCKFCSLNSSLELLFLDSKLPGEFIKLLFIVTGHLGSLSQVLVKLLNSNFVVHALALNNLDLLENLISLL